MKTGGYYCSSIVLILPTYIEFSDRHIIVPLASPSHPTQTMRFLLYTVVSASLSFIPFTAEVAMLDLASRVKTALENPNVAPWLPELTEELAGIGWAALDRGIGLTINDYSTSRVLSANSCASQNIITHLPTFQGAEGAKSTIFVESLPTDIARPYLEAGISFYTSDEIKDTK